MITEQERRKIQFIGEVQAERLRQDAKWGPRPEIKTMAELLLQAVVLGEESGEVMRAVLEIGSCQRKGTSSAEWEANLRTELVQVAAVCQKIFEALP